jgi:hypothetical protein
VATTDPLRNGKELGHRRDEDVVERMPYTFYVRTTMNPPGPSATDIQSHLYNSFIHASTYDVLIRVSGRTWRAIYKLHRVVLIQSVYDISPILHTLLTISARAFFVLYSLQDSRNLNLPEGAAPTRLISSSTTAI